MIYWAIRLKGKGYVNENDEYGKLMDAEFYPTKTEAQQSVKEKNEEAVKIEVRVVG